MKKIIIGLIAVFAVGVIGAVISAAASDFTKDEVKAAETYDASDIKKIKVTTTSMNTEVKSGQTDDIQVAAEGKVSDKSKKLFDVSQDGKSLKINQKVRENIISFNPWSSEKDMKITITIPEKKYDEITVTTTSGDILIENAQMDQSAADSTSGNIEVKHTRIKNELTLKTTSGDIQADQNSFGQGEVKTTSGSIKSSDTTAKKVNYKTTSGDIDLLQDNQNEEIDIVTTSGSVSVAYQKEPASLAVDFQADSGDASVNLDQILYKEKSEHRIVGYVGDSGISNHLKVRTTSGDIELN
ncbi:lia operon protein LiaG [Bacillus subtilis]